MKNAAAMKKEIAKIEASLMRLKAAHEKMDAKGRELKFDSAKDKRMKKDLKKDVKKSVKKRVMRKKK